MKLIISTMLTALLLMASSVSAANWLIFDIAGDASLTQDSGTVKLSLKKHLLKEISAGDIITTADKGRVVLVSTVTNNAHEISGNAVIEVGDQELTATKGSFTLRKGYSLPKKKSKLMAGVIMRGEETQECLLIFQGSNTAVHTLTPTLQWQNQCDDNKVHISLFSDAGLLMEFDSGKDEVIVPAGELNYGGRYVWLLETSNGSQVSAASFNTLSEPEAIKIARKMRPSGAQQQDFSARIADIFYFREHRLNDLADGNLAKLSREYPDVDFQVILDQ